jgi:hypothetical protein
MSTFGSLMGGAATGLCFPFAARWFPPINGRRGSPAYRRALKAAYWEVVHGAVVVNGQHKPHAWVEYNGRVFDWQNRETHPAGIPRARFYLELDARIDARYPKHEVVALCHRHNHWGPFS